MRIKVFLYMLSFTLPLLSAEPSIFGAPEKEKKEQEIFKQKIQKELYDFSVSLKKLKETQNGMQSLFDSQSKKLQELYVKNQKTPFATQAELQESLKDLNGTLITNFRTYDESFESLKNGLESLGGLIEELHKTQKQDTDDLLSRLEALEENLKKEKENFTKELNTLKDGQLNKVTIKQQDLVKQSDQEGEKNPQSIKQNESQDQQSSQENQSIDDNKTQKDHEEKKSENKDNKDDVLPKENQLDDPKTIIIQDKQKQENVLEKDIQDEGEQEVKLDSLPNGVVHKDGLTFFKKGDLEQAKRYLKHSVDKGYKPATSMYYLGEIAYQQKRFEEAIGYYKESATRYDKASYIPNLLLHTAISFRELGDKSNAKNFLDILIGSYPDSKETREAKAILKTLK